MSRSRLGRGDLGPMVALALLMPALLWRLTLAGQILQGPDVFSYFYPLYEHTAGRLAQGQLPLWNPYLFLGSPFLANPQTAVFYPLHWPLSWLPVTDMVAATLTAHYALAAVGTYVLARVVFAHGRWAAVAAAICFGAGGLLGAQVEHINQVEGLAWLPWQLLALELGALSAGPQWRRRARWLALGAALSALQLLAGHTQATYIAHVTVVVYGVCRAFIAEGEWRERLATATRAIAYVAGVAALAAGLAAVQLLPTLELAALSARSGGLEYRQAASFSFGPRHWLLGLLPHYGGEAAFTEYVAYVGVAGLVLAALGVARGQHRTRLALGALSLVGLGLSLGLYNPLYYLLYRLVPGMDLFRVPARWLVTYVVAVSLLVAEGVGTLAQLSSMRLPGRRWAGAALAGAAITGALWLVASPRPGSITMAGWGAAALAVLVLIRWGPRRLRPAMLVGLLMLELVLGSLSLPAAQATAAAPYYAQRRSTQVLLAAGGLGRVLSVSEPTFESGDRADLMTAYGAGLSERGRAGLLVVTKAQEVLSRNLALRWRLFAVDGYDGGVLPTRDFLALSELFAPESERLGDGRLGEALSTVPPRRLLDLVGVSHLITDRLQDLWLDGAHHDLSAPLLLALGDDAVEVPLPALPMDAVSLIFRVGPEGTLGSGDIRLGEAWLHWTSQGEAVAVDTGGAVMAGQPVPERPDLVRVLVPLGPGYAVAERLEVAPPEAGRLVLMGASAVNTRVPASKVIDLAVAQGRRTVHLGDVRLSQVLEPMRRAYFATCGEVVPDEETALARLTDQAFNPRTMLLVTEGGLPACSGAPVQPAEVISYDSERIVVHVQAEAPGMLVLLDSYYPGWQATVDGQPASIVRANWFFRGVPLPAGEREVVFEYRPPSLHTGAWISLAGAVAWLALLFVSRSEARSVDLGRNRVL